MEPESTVRSLIVEGARQNNLKNISLTIPHDRVIAVTGLSGSGKSSLAFDTLFAEGQWRYVESLSTYARMFLEKVSRPDVDRILNVRPAIAIEQKNQVRTARSTVGTSTEIADLLRLLFAKIGKPICPDCNQEVRAFHPDTVVDDLLARFSGARAMILFPIASPTAKQEQDVWQTLLTRGYARLKIGEDVIDLHDAARPLPRTEGAMHVVLDRLIIGDDTGLGWPRPWKPHFEKGTAVAPWTSSAPACRRTAAGFSARAAVGRSSR
jgi:excinuclease ABC subunit A